MRRGRQASDRDYHFFLRFFLNRSFARNGKYDDSSESTQGIESNIPVGIRDKIFSVHSPFLCFEEKVRGGLEYFPENTGAKDDRKCQPGYFFQGQVFPFPERFAKNEGEEHGHDEM